MNNITKKQFLSKFGKACFNLALSTSALSATAATQSYYRSRDAQKGNGAYLADLNLSPFFAVNFEKNQLTLNSGLDINQGLSQHKPFHAEKGTAVKELLIIDTDVQNKSVFLAQQRPGVEVIEIKKGGLSKLMEVLASYRNLDAVHLVSHAQPGAIQLGGEVVSAETFQESVAAFTAINQSIKPGGDLLFYGCELAKGKQGEDFVTIIKGNTHVDIAASDDPTGNTNYNGDWDLEIQQGNIDATPVSESIAMTDFTGVLQLFSGPVDIFNSAINSGGSTSSDDATFNLGGSTLVVDGQDTGINLYTPPDYTDSTTGIVYTYEDLTAIDTFPDFDNPMENAVTLSFSGGETFQINGITSTISSYDSTIGDFIPINMVITDELNRQTMVSSPMGTSLSLNLSAFGYVQSLTITEQSGLPFSFSISALNIAVQSTLSSSNFDFNTFNIYPNPATDKVSFTKEVDRAIIYNMSGQQVGSYDNVKDIDMTALQPGLYYIAIEIEGSSITRKLVKK